MSFQAFVGEPKLNDEVVEPEPTFGIIDPLIKSEPDIVWFPLNVLDPVVGVEPVGANDPVWLLVITVEPLY